MLSTPVLFADWHVETISKFGGSCAPVEPVRLAPLASKVGHAAYRTAGCELYPQQLGQVDDTLTIRYSHHDHAGGRNPIHPKGNP